MMNNSQPNYANGSSAYSSRSGSPDLERVDELPSAQFFEQPGERVRTPFPTAQQPIHESPLPNLPTILVPSTSQPQLQHPPLNRQLSANSGLSSSSGYSGSQAASVPHISFRNAGNVVQGSRDNLRVNIIRHSFSLEGMSSSSSSSHDASGSLSASSSNVSLRNTVNVVNDLRDHRRVLERFSVASGLLEIGNFLIPSLPVKQTLLNEDDSINGREPSPEVYLINTTRIYCGLAISLLLFTTGFIAVCVISYFPGKKMEMNEIINFDF